MNNPIIGQLLIQIFLISLNAIFACAEIAIISMNDNKLAQLATKGDKRAIKLTRLTSQPARFLATIQVAITLSGFLGSAFAADNFSDILVHGLISLGVTIPVKTLDTIAVILITLLLSYFTLVFGELVPKRIAMKKAEALALGMANLISFISKIFAPIVWVLTGSTNLILRIIGIDPNAEEEEVSEEEIRMLVDIGSQKGVIELQEKEMIQNIFEFNDLTVGEFATHRTDVSFLWMEEDLETWENTINNSRHTIFPVCKETVDNVVGVLNVKDYYRLQTKTKKNLLENGIKPAFFIPEGVKADVLFKQMKQKHNHFSIVLDEYGGMLGIVTMNDLLEQLVGDLTDESTGLVEEEIQKLDDGTYKILGGSSLDEVSASLQIDLPTEEYDTFGGYVFGTYGIIPKDGSEFEIETEKLHIRVIDIKDHRIESSIVSMK